jgi:hypothetical protein
VQQPAPSPPQAAEPLFTLVERAWIQPDLKDRPHRAEGIKVAGKKVYLCGKAVPFPDALKDVLLEDEWPLPNFACKDCVTQLVIRRYAVFFKLGEKVVSRAENMTLYGVIRGMFEHDGKPMLNLDRIWLKKPQESRIGKYGDYFEHDLSVSDWYRYVSDCEPWKATR